MTLGSAKLGPEKLGSVHVIIDRFRNLNLSENISLKGIILMNIKPHACKRTVYSSTFICRVVRM